MCQASYVVIDVDVIDDPMFGVITKMEGSPFRKYVITIEFACLLHITYLDCYFDLRLEWMIFNWNLYHFRFEENKNVQTQIHHFQSCKLLQI